MSEESQHLSLVLEFSKGLFQATCSCGWISTITFFEVADLLRAMHVHAVVTFVSYKIERRKN